MLLVYVLRSLRKRFRTNLVTILSIALFVAGCSVSIAFYLGLKKRVVDSTPADQVLVLSRGASGESSSRIELDTVRKVVLLPGVKADPQPLAARELLSSMGVSNEGSTSRGRATVRGYDESSIKVHGVTVKGNMPGPGTFELLVGEELLAKYPNLKVGSTLALPAGTATVTGTFVGRPGDDINEEIWTPRAALEQHTKSKDTSSIVMVAESAERVPEVVAKVKESKDLQADAYSLREYRAADAGLAKIIRIVLLMIILLSVVAGFAISSTMSAAIRGRMSELAVLTTVGFRRARLGRIVVLESVLLAAIGAGLGIAASFGVQKILVDVGKLKVDVMTTPIALAIGLGLGLLVGLVGGLAPANQVRRLEIIKFMR